MHILFFSHYFPPEVNAPATRTFEHCRRWVEAGHEVTVVTCVPNCPAGIAFDGYRNRLRRQVEVIEGIRVVRVWTHLAPNAGTARRIANYVSYCASAVPTSLRGIERPDVIVATSPQFFCGWAGIWSGRLRRVPRVLEIRDIWPESIAAVGAMRRGIMVRYLEWLERRMYAAADRIVTVGTGYRDQILARAPGLKRSVDIISNGVSPTEFTPRPRDASFLDRYGLQGKFICSYAGTIGMAHGLEVVIRAARRLKDAGRDDVRFLIVGDGANRERLEREAEAAGVDRWVRFTGRLPRTEMPVALASSDVCLVHLRGTELFGTVVPSKIFETMAMQRPIIMGVRGPAREIVMQSGAGQPMEPDADDDLARIVGEMADEPERWAAAGREAREFVLEHYNRDALAERYLELLKEVVAGRRGTAGADGVEVTLGAGRYKETAGENVGV